MRKLSELYSIVLELHKSFKLQSADKFICNAIEKAYKTELISEEEMQKLFEHFKPQRPSKEVNPEFFVKISYSPPMSAWWNCIDDTVVEGVEIREKFLEKMIQITKEQNL